MLGGLSFAVLAVVAVILWAAHSPIQTTLPKQASAGTFANDDVAASIEQVNQFFEKDWQAAGITPAAGADDLLLFRRLSLSLHGTVPSLEEIRLFQSDKRADRLRYWTAKLLVDERFNNYFAERLARSLVGVGEGQFIVFRRDRFSEWLREMLREDRPYNETAQQLITGEGLWTDTPQTSFITAGVDNNKLDVNKLAGRSMRVFLGQRMDCAQCHDHPFAEWKQSEYEGLAAYYGQTQFTVLGVKDHTTGKKNKPIEYEVTDFKEDEAGQQIEFQRTVKPAVPFHPEWLPSTGSRRTQLAAWVTHAKNRRFERAIVNRVWGLLYGLPYYAPVDDLPDPEPIDPLHPELLDLLGADFRTHNYSLKRLITVMAASRPFHLQSKHPETDAGKLADIEEHWAVFPLMRLRPEQVIGSMLQAGSVKTIDQNSHLIVRTLRFFREGGFLEDYGDLGEDELETHSGTIPQALLRMNGDLPKEILKASPLSASGRIRSLSSSPENIVANSYLVCLTRNPAPAELAYFVKQFKDKENQSDYGQSSLTEDLFWALFNSPEFSWNH